MINANETQVVLEKWYSDNVRFWSNNKQDPVDEKEANRRALEWDIIEIYKFNGNCLHDNRVPNGEALDEQTVIAFIKARCQDLYGRDWEQHWKEYNL